MQISFREHRAVWSEEPFGVEKRELLGVRARVVPLEVLRRGKATPRDEPHEAAVDRADYAVLSRL